MEALSINGGVMKVEKSPPVLVSPDSETPVGPYFLSSFDQALPFPVRLMFAFEKSDDTLADVLKASLRKALVHFYPFAGAMAVDSGGRFAIDCSKKSVPFVEAVANCTIDMMGDVRLPNPETTGKLFYMDPNVKSFLDIPLLTIQVTKFECGGFTLGLTISHPMADGLAFMTFINTWTAIARGGTPTGPSLDRTCLKARSPKNMKGPYDDYVLIADESDMESLYEKEENICRLFTFTSEKIAAIKKAALADGRLENCSTFTALSAVVWRARSKALKMRPSQLTKLRIIMDVRSKLKDKIPSNYFGNLITTTCVLTTAGDLEEQPISCTVEQIRKACEKVDEDYVRSRIDYIDVYRPVPTSVGTLVVSSWTQLSFDSTDFGWGTPTKFGWCDTAKELGVFLPEGEGKKGIAVVLSLPVSAMKTFKELIDQL